MFFKCLPKYNLTTVTFPDHFMWTRNWLPWSTFYSCASFIFFFPQFSSPLKKYPLIDCPYPGKPLRPWRTSVTFHSSISSAQDNAGIWRYLAHICLMNKSVVISSLSFSSSSPSPSECFVYTCLCTREYTCMWHEQSNNLIPLLRTHLLCFCLRQQRCPHYSPIWVSSSIASKMSNT